jgi:hypothetical protein
MIVMKQSTFAFHTEHLLKNFGGKKRSRKVSGRRPNIQKELEQNLCVWTIDFRFAPCCNTSRWGSLPLPKQHPHTRSRGKKRRGGGGGSILPPLPSSLLLTDIFWHAFVQLAKTEKNVGGVLIFISVDGGWRWIFIEIDQLL